MIPPPHPPYPSNLTALAGSDSLRARIESVLPRVEKPARYLGNELHAIRKPPADAEVRAALVFPEVYEIGMSWPGLQILYHALNSRPGVAAERAYSYWPDMEAEMRRASIPAFSLETWTPLAEFDILGFTLQHELLYTNLLQILDLAGIPLRSSDRLGERGREYPLILAGGPGAFNCEPIADFLDAVALGDGEEVFLEICDAMRGWKRSGTDRPALLRRLALIPGVYVPSQYETEYKSHAADGCSMPAIRAIRPRPGSGAPASVRRRWVADIDKAPFPSHPLVPAVRTVHERLGIEVQRGCTRACRFCQAGYIYRPVRQRRPETVRRLAAESLRATGYDEVGLLSLSIGDYACLETLLDALLHPAAPGAPDADEFADFDKRPAVSLPSIRVDTLREGILERIASVRRTGFTIAPEAGSPRLRQVINKPLTEDQIAHATDLVFSRGWTHLKLYYILGLPTETDEDLMGIVNTARSCLEIARRHTNRAEIVVSASTFVPKPFTPFQWAPQITREEIQRRQGLLRDALRRPGLSFKWHDNRASFLEAVMSRGDRRLSHAIERAFRGGARFDSWTEHLREDLWREAFAACEIDPAYYAHREIPHAETLPWDHIDCGVSKDWLWRDHKAGLRGSFMANCATDDCQGCGICDFENIKNRTYNPGKSAPSDQSDKPDRPDGPGQFRTSAQPPQAQSDSTEDTPRRFRVQFAKQGRSAWLGHLDLMEIMARAFKRAGLRAAYSKGHHPKPKFSFGPALMTGAESLCEYIDADLLPPISAASGAPAPEKSADWADPANFAGWIERVNGGLPEGIRLLSLEEIQRGLPSLGAAIEGFVFEIEERMAGVLPEPGIREEALGRFLAKSEALVETPKRIYNVRPYVRQAAVIPGGFRLAITCTVEGGSARPADVVRAILGWADAAQRDSDQCNMLLVRKTATWFRGENVPGGG